MKCQNISILWDNIAILVAGHVVAAFKTHQTSEKSTRGICRTVNMIETIPNPFFLTFCWFHCRMFSEIQCLRRVAKWGGFSKISFSPYFSKIKRKVFTGAHDPALGVWEISKKTTKNPTNNNNKNTKSSRCLNHGANDGADPKELLSVVSEIDISPSFSSQTSDSMPNHTIFAESVQSMAANMEEVERMVMPRKNCSCCWINLSLSFSSQTSDPPFMPSRTEPRRRYLRITSYPLSSTAPHTHIS